MYELNDTIIAISSPASDKRVIFRITGPDTIDNVKQIFGPAIPDDKPGILRGLAIIDTELSINAKLYLFLAPYSYTGETLAEIHIHTNASAAEVLIGRLLSEGLRMAGPGEFTARAYLNGKIDLAQAEAVNEVITSCNKFQLAAAEKLLGGQLGETTKKIQSSIMDCLSLIEAGMDFSSEDIEFITQSEAVRRLTVIKNQLEQLLNSSISYESLIDLPAVGIAGATNAGKSSLLNKLLGKTRSIVSEQRKTTRDVLTALCTLVHCRSVLFDCAGLIQSPKNILDELAQQAAIEALRNSSVVIFCVDVSKTNWAEDISILELIEPKVLVPVATKCDLLTEGLLAERMAELNDLFAAKFTATSVKSGSGIELLWETIDRKIIEETVDSTESAAPSFSSRRGSSVALTARHKQAVTEAIESVGQSVNELKNGRDEVAAMMLRAAYQAISNIEQQSIDEQILENIFSRFCIGK